MSFNCDISYIWGEGDIQSTSGSSQYREFSTSVLPDTEELKWSIIFNMKMLYQQEVNNCWDKVIHGARAKPMITLHINYPYTGPIAGKIFPVVINAKSMNSSATETSSILE